MSDPIDINLAVERAIESEVQHIAVVAGSMELASRMARDTADWCQARHIPCTQDQRFRVWAHRTQIEFTSEQTVQRFLAGRRREFSEVIYVRDQRIEFRHTGNLAVRYAIDNSLVVAVVLPTAYDEENFIQDMMTWLRTSGKTFHVDAHHMIIDRAEIWFCHRSNQDRILSGQFAVRMYDAIIYAENRTIMSDGYNQITPKCVLENGVWKYLTGRFNGQKFPCILSSEHRQLCRLVGSQDDGPWSDMSLRTVNSDICFGCRTTALVELAHLSERHDLEHMPPAVQYDYFMDADDDRAMALLEIYLQLHPDKRQVV